MQTWKKERRGGVIVIVGAVNLPWALYYPHFNQAYIVISSMFTADLHTADVFLNADNLFASADNLLVEQSEIQKESENIHLHLCNKGKGTYAPKLIHLPHLYLSSQKKSILSNRGQ